jgi:predicted PurR-regulated permease PerM
MNFAGGIFEALSNVLTNAFLILLAVVFILLEAADFQRNCGLCQKIAEKSLSSIERFSLGCQALFGH